MTGLLRAGWGAVKIFNHSIVEKIVGISDLEWCDWFELL